MNSLKIFFRTSAEKSIIVTGIKVALVVGVILNLINQGEVLVSFDLAKLDFLKFILTFFVPFGVSVYSSTRLKLKIKIGQFSKIEARLECITCGDTSYEIKKGEEVGECVNCGEKTKYRVIDVKD